MSRTTPQAAQMLQVPHPRRHPTMEKKKEGAEDGPSDATEAFWQYRKAKRNWRRLSGKPVRKFRRHAKRFFKKRFFDKNPRKGKGKGKGFRPRRKQFSQGWKRAKVFHGQQAVLLESYFKNKKGKGGGGKSSGKGFGRKSGNPSGPDGKKLGCHNCGSTDHFIKDCPKKRSGKGGSSSSSMPDSMNAMYNRNAGPLTYTGPIFEEIDEHGRPLPSPMLYVQDQSDGTDLRNLQGEADEDEAEDYLPRWSYMYEEHEVRSNMTAYCSTLAAQPTGRREKCNASLKREKQPSNLRTLGKERSYPARRVKNPSQEKTHGTGTIHIHRRQHQDLSHQPKHPRHLDNQQHPVATPLG